MWRIWQATENQLFLTYHKYWLDLKINYLQIKYKPLTDSHCGHIVTSAITALVWISRLVAWYNVNSYHHLFFQLSFQEFLFSQFTSLFPCVSVNGQYCPICFQSKVRPWHLHVSPSLLRPGFFIKLATGLQISWTDWCGLQADELNLWLLGPLHHSRLHYTTTMWPLQEHTQTLALSSVHLLSLWWGQCRFLL